MKFYSDVTRKLYDTEEALHEAETAVKCKEEEERLAREHYEQEKEARTKVLNAAYEAKKKAEKDYEALLKDYCKDYGHASISDKEYHDSLNELMNLIFPRK